MYDVSRYDEADVIRLDEAAEPIRAALERLAESPRELRCFVIVEDPLTKCFAQFCTPLPPSKFAASPRLTGDGPIIFDGHGNGKDGGYVPIQVFCDVELGVAFALDALAAYLPEEAELRIVEESTQRERPS